MTKPRKTTRKAAPKRPASQRITDLERRLAAAEERIAQLETGPQPLGPMPGRIIPFDTDRVGRPIDLPPTHPDIVPITPTMPTIDPHRIGEPYEITCTAETPASIRSAQ